jgi:uncharacterized protein (TIGR02246 family)
MTEEKIASIMRDLIKSLETGDVEKTLSFFAEDGVWINPNGTFKGKEELRRYLTNSAQLMRDVKVTETGNKIIVQGNKAFYEHDIAATIEGKRAEGLAMCAYEFTNDKIQAEHQPLCLCILDSFAQCICYLSAMKVPFKKYRFLQQMTGF